MTKKHRAALVWLNEHGGDGIFTDKGRVLATGELCPSIFTRAVWEGLERARGVEFYKARPTDKALRVRALRMECY